MLAVGTAVWIFIRVTCWAWARPPAVTITAATAPIMSFRIKVAIIASSYICEPPELATRRAANFHYCLLGNSLSTEHLRESCRPPFPQS
jgi:hypothetical protein